MKKILATFLALAMGASLLSGCAPAKVEESKAPEATKVAESPAEQPTEAPKEEAAAPAEEAKKTLTIGVSLNAADEYRTSWLNAFEKQAKEKGYTVYSTNADSDASKQISDIESLLAKQPDIMVIHAFNADAAAPAIDAIAAKGIPCILFDFPVNTDTYTTLITDKQYLNGQIQGEYVNQWLAEDTTRKANVGYLVGMYSMEAAMPRMEGFFDTCTAAVKVAEAEGGWSVDGAMKITEDWLQAHPEINVYACMNDDMAIGVIQALTAAKKDMSQILVLGIDGTDAAKEYLASGDLDATAARDIDKEAGFTLKTCEEIVLEGKTVEKELYPEAIFALTANK